MALPRLPDDIIYEVFSRTSLKTLGRIRLLNKEWNQRTYDSTFTKQLHERTKTISGFFIQNIRHCKHRSSFVSIDDDDENPKETNKVSLSFLPPGAFRTSPVKILASTPQGIFLCEKDTEKRNVPQYYVCKPTTKQWQAIPNPKTRFFTKAVGMMVLRSNPLRYKIVRFSERVFKWVKYKSEWYYTVRCEVFDSETWAWKQFKEDIRFPHSLYLSDRAVVSACGKINWLQPDNHIFAFDFNTESWEIFALPREVILDDQCDDDAAYYRKLGQVMEIVGYEGRLGLVCMGRDEECMRLWVMEDNGHNKVWRKRKTISIEELKTKESQTSPLAFCNTDVVLMKGYYYKLIFYKFENYCNTSTSSTYSKVVPWDGYFISQVFPLESDFEPVYLGAKPPLSDPKSVLNHTSSNIISNGVLGLLGTYYVRTLNWSNIFLLLCILVAFYFFMYSSRFVD